MANVQEAHPVFPRRSRRRRRHPLSSTPCTHAAGVHVTYSVLTPTHTGVLGTPHVEGPLVIEQVMTNADAFFDFRRNWKFDARTPHQTHRQTGAEVRTSPACTSFRKRLLCDAVVAEKISASLSIFSRIE